MTTVDEALRRELLETHDEFRSLYERHQEHERRLEELRLKSVLSEEDELEEKQIKRQKLFLKDRMESILRAAKESGVSA